MKSQFKIVVQGTKLIADYLKKNLKLTKYKVLELKNLNLNKIIKINVKNKKQLGSDRIANAIGAKKFKNCLVLDFGTATTFDVIKNSVYEGGVIAPGGALSTKALHEAAAALPHVEVKRPPNVVGRNTINCMQSGIYWGYLSLVEGIILKIKKEKKISNVIATGGLANVFSRDTSIFDKIDLRLTIKGLVYISSFNEDK